MSTRKCCKGNHHATESSWKSPQQIRCLCSQFNLLRRQGGTPPAPWDLFPGAQHDSTYISTVFLRSPRLGILLPSPAPNEAARSLLAEHQAIAISFFLAIVIPYVYKIFYMICSIISLSICKWNIIWNIRWLRLMQFN